MYNSIVRINYLDEEKNIINFSFVTPDHQEHELDIPAWMFLNFKEFEPIPAEYDVHPACCEHPKRCPLKTRTEEILEEFNSKSIDKR